MPLAREPGAQVAADLLRAPAPGQQLADGAPQPAAGVNAPQTGPGAAQDGLPLSLEGTVVPADGGIAAQLPRDRRRRSAQPGSDLLDAHARLAQVGDLDPLVLRQEPAADLAHRQPLERRHEPGDLPAAVGLVTARPVRPARARHPDLAGSRIDAPPPLAQLDKPLALGRQRTPPRPLLHPTRRQHDP